MSANRAIPQNVIPESSFTVSIGSSSAPLDTTILDNAFGTIMDTSLHVMPSPEYINNQLAEMSERLTIVEKELEEAQELAKQLLRKSEIIVEFQTRRLRIRRTERR